jgi:DHA1 family bicyclomycin/chloramphenicol resistance-like MFS transporter
MALLPQARARSVVEPGGREFLAIVATCMAMAAMSIDLLLPAFGDMRAEFGLAPDSTEVSRVITAFFFGLALGQLVYGPLSDRFGRKRLLYVGLLVYVLAAAASTTTEHLGTLVACRFVWGFGAAAPRSLALAMIRDTHEGDRMARAMSNVMATFILVPIFAPAIGSVALAFAEWHIVLWIPVVAAGVLVLWTFRLPETLPPANRRPVSPQSLVEAAAAVVRNRQTLAFGAAATCLFAVMTSYIGSTEVIIDEVFGQKDLFPVLFGLLAVGLALGSLLAGRLVMRIGLARLVRYAAVYVAGTAALLAVVAVASDGHPPLWLFMAATALMLPGVTALVPNCNTAAMAPLPHVAGMAAALLGTISTAGGALLGSVVDGAYDGSVRPFGIGALVFALLALGFVLLAGRPPVVGAAEAARSDDLSMSAADAVVAQAAVRIDR